MGLAMVKEECLQCGRLQEKTTLLTIARDKSNERCIELEHRMASVMEQHEEMLTEKAMLELKIMEAISAHDRAVQRNVDFQLKAELVKELQRDIEQQKGEIRALRNLVAEGIKTSG